MKNKVNFKKYLSKTIVVILLLLIVFIAINIYEYHVYNVNYNKAIASILTTITESYPNIDESTIIDILNSSNIDESLLLKYSIDIDNYPLIQANNNYFKVFLVLNVSLIIILLLVLFLGFILYLKRRNKELDNITKYIENINDGNYHLDIEDFSEDELSILKEEVYKTMILLKEGKESSLHDKMMLKDSLSDVSHQLKTPLTSIMIMLDNLEDDDMPKTIREDFIKDIRNEVVSINFLVQSILKLSKFDACTIEFKQNKISLDALVTTSVKNVAMLTELKGITVLADTDDTSFIGDFNWQVEALTNVIKNSVEHSKNGSTIEIKARGNKMYTKIEIKDYGNGISKDDLPHIFERFYKGSSSSDTSIGIGLALAKSIIESDNGSIGVESVPDEYTKFSIKYYR